MAAHETVELRPKTDHRFETSVKGLFVAGDGAGITRGLAQAGVGGIQISRVIAEKETH